VSYDRRTVHAVLDEAVVCHVGFVVDGRPVVLPQLHARVGDRLYLHGSTGARALRTARDGGLAVCVTVTLVDGLVLARSAFHHSVNYRSVVVHGAAHVVTDPAEKSAALEALVDRVVPGRTAGTRAPDRRELAATSVLRLPLDEVSVKVRSGPPKDDAEDLDGPHWAGVLPLSTVPGEPVPAPDLAAGIGTPAHVTAWHR
jgi:nitroimidazol reductase NimA-like FMN-containing flavoprotein (pyridoxamine 5'-phosphate oxidase superfamily)